MSLILDALRKSEAERQRGKSPGLFATTPGVQRETFPRMKLWPVLVFLAFLLASAWVIWQGESRRAEGEQAATAVTQTADAGVQVIDGRAAAEGSMAAGDRPARTVAPEAPASPAATDPARGQGAPSPPPAAVTPVLPAPAAAPQSVPAVPTAPLPAPVAVVDAPATESLPTVAVLDADTRASLPPLKLSMHVFGQDPAKRFAIIDGKRVGAGSLLGSGVVEEISRDGVVININGQRLLVPKP